VEEIVSWRDRETALGPADQQANRPVIGLFCQFRQQGAAHHMRVDCDTIAFLKRCGEAMKPLSQAKAFVPSLVESVGIGRWTVGGSS
jgi:hypothetical protein